MQRFVIKTFEFFFEFVFCFKNKRINFDFKSRHSVRFKRLINKNLLIFFEISSLETDFLSFKFLNCFDIIYFYKQRPTIDGGLHYKKYIKTLTPKTLVVNFKMFGRYKHINMMKEQFKKYKPSAYFLYIKGYQDAKKNHAYFEKYLN